MHKNWNNANSEDFFNRQEQSNLKTAGRIIYKLCLDYCHLVAPFQLRLLLLQCCRNVTIFCNLFFRQSSFCSLLYDRSRVSTKVSFPNSEISHSASPFKFYNILFFPLRPYSNCLLNQFVKPIINFFYLFKLRFKSVFKSKNTSKWT
jgi:hypothetical protein